MSESILDALPARHGHFLLESGYHTDFWFDLDTLFVSPKDISPLVTKLASRLQAYEPTAVCGPLLGGAFLAQAIANELRVRFYFTEPEPTRREQGLFQQHYRLPGELERVVSGERVAVVDDVISAGSSVRATIAALIEAGAEIVAAGSLVILGTAGADYLSSSGIPIEALARRDFSIWHPEQCPMCGAGVLLTNPASGADEKRN